MPSTKVGADRSISFVHRCTLCLVAHTADTRNHGCTTHACEKCTATEMVALVLVCTASIMTPRSTCPPLQPRRLAAIGVAERVASERCEPIGKTIGYQIRLEARRSAATRLLFCTTGILLRRLSRDRNLDGVSHVIVDEVCLGVSSGAYIARIWSICQPP
eukprot:scaffold79210_cov28-Tisochrysis_lutea.AAC.2